VKPLEIIQKIQRDSANRAEMWTRILGALSVNAALEIGVYRGEFAAEILRSVADIDTYFMIDPWRHLEDWNKPFNTDDESFEQIMLEALTRTAFAGDRRKVLRGKTSEVIESVPDSSLDFAYVDGDHTLRGITIDLLRVWPKLKDGAILAGDDFHAVSRFRPERPFEPSLVFPWAVNFAEAMRSTILALPHSQFAIVINKSGVDQFEFVDCTGKYASTEVRALLR
jgi:hypothetical protein